MQSMYEMAKERYAALGVDVERAMEKLRHAPVSLHCWQGDDVRGFDTDPTKPLTGGIQTTGNYPGRARTPEELMADLDLVLKLCPGTKKMNLHATTPSLTTRTAAGWTGTSWSPSTSKSGWTSARRAAWAATSTPPSFPTPCATR